MYFQLESLTPEQLVCGYVHDAANRKYVCIICGAAFEEGEIHPVGIRFYDSERAAALHVQTHGDRLEQLLSSGGRSVALTENQCAFLRMLRAGLSDAEIAHKSGVSPSTVRQQRFQMREKEKQAKMYLALCRLASAGRSGEDRLLAAHDGAKMVDERYVVTEKESAAILANAFLSLDPLRLKVFPVKEKKKLVILARIASCFVRDKTYSEREINAVLTEIYPDYVTLRRYLIEYGFMERTTDCASYWMK